MVSLKDRLLKNSTLEFTASLEDSKIFGKKDMIPTTVPMLNMALSSSFDGGLTPGTTMIAGDSKHFKSGFMLLLAKAFLDKYDDGIILFYDSEFGTPLSYIKSFNLPTDKVIHSPVTDLEELTFDVVAQLEDIKREDHVLIMIDSLGNVASKREVENAKNEKSVEDFTRAKKIKALFRMIGPKIVLKDIPLIAINHVYDDMGLFPKKIVSGGAGSYYNSDNIWIIGREQDKKQGEELKGYNFIINVEKSRYLKEKSRIPINVRFDHGLSRWTGLIDQAIQGKFVVQSGAWCNEVDLETGEVKTPARRKEDIANDDKFWQRLLQEPLFKKFVEEKYRLSHGLIIKENEPELIN